MCQSGSICVIITPPPCVFIGLLLQGIVGFTVFFLNTQIIKKFLMTDVIYQQFHHQITNDSQNVTHVNVDHTVLMLPSTSL